MAFEERYISRVEGGQWTSARDGVPRLTSDVQSPNKRSLVVAPATETQGIDVVDWTVLTYNGPGDVSGSGHMVAGLDWLEHIAGTCVLGISREGKIIVYGGTLTNGVNVQGNLDVRAGGVIGNAFIHDVSVENAGTIAHLVGYRFPDLSAIVTNDGYRMMLRNEDPTAKMLRRVGSGASASYGNLGSMFGVLTTEDATDGTGLEVLNGTLVIPAGALASVGDTVTVETEFRCAATNDNKNIGLRVGADSLQTGNVGAGSNNATGIFKATVTKTGVDTQHIIFAGQLGSTVYAGNANGTNDDGADMVIWPLATSSVAAEITNIGVRVFHYPVGAAV